MMSKLKFLVLGFSFTLFAFSFALTCFAQPITSAELISNAKIYNGKAVNFSGEVIGDVMRRASFAWININDGNNAIGVWIRLELTKDIVYTGSFKSRGDRVEVTGIFNRACLEHGGDLDIHAQALRKINSGRMVPEHVNIDKINLSLIFLGVLCLVLILTKLMRK